MSTATARAYRSNFTGRTSPAESRKSREIKPFHGCRSTYLRQAHCIKDRVLLEDILKRRFSYIDEAVYGRRLYG